jgi:hypothetical protein
MPRARTLSVTQAHQLLQASCAGRTGSRRMYADLGRLQVASAQQFQLTVVTATAWTYSRTSTTTSVHWLYVEVHLMQSKYATRLQALLRRVVSPALYQPTRESASKDMDILWTEYKDALREVYCRSCRSPAFAARACNQHKTRQSTHSA